MNRVTQVKTPNDKYIYYSYDGFGRQSVRQTPDAGYTKYKYDKSDNLRFSLDENQKHREEDMIRTFTFRGYDGINRLIYTGVINNLSYTALWEDLNGETKYNFENYNTVPEDYLMINAYDTLIGVFGGGITDNIPSNYYSSVCNNTSGKLVATAYRTNGTDNWNYKYYRYDSRGRVIKQWNIISGLGTKVIEYKYNSQNQITNVIYQSSENDFREFQYTYDKAGRMETVGIDGIPSENLNTSFVTFASYAYNENSQTRSFVFDPINIAQSYQYNSRNRLTSSTCTKQNLFSYNLGFQKNGNVQNQSFTGSYRSGFSETSDLVVNYTYDYSNRLLNANYTSPFNTSFDLTNTFDYDGNMLTLQRFGSNSNLIDNFSYSYNTGTNRLSSISTTPNLYQYDWNGNVTDDFFNNNTSIKYDNRNLITEIIRIEGATDPPLTYTTNYYYDESGNRIRKTVGKDAGSSREIITDEIYVRDISGREIAIYDIRSTAALEYWNVWAGSELIGRINPTENDRYYYFKDHLGTIRAVYDNSKNIIYAQDYDMWGFPLQNRVSGNDTIKNKFTGKERDKETTYDYFGARFYDSRIGRWLSIDPSFNKFIKFTPFNYACNNPLTIYDPDNCDYSSIDFHNKY